MKTRKQELVKLVKNIVCGIDAHTSIIFGKKQGKWVYQTGLNNFSKSDFADWENVQTAKHCCNNCTTKDILEMYFNN